MTSGKWKECEWCFGTMRVKIKDDLLKNRSVDSYVAPAAGWRGKPWSAHINAVFSQYEVQFSHYVFLQGIILRGEESCQAQCFTVLYILVWLRLFKERWKIPDMNLLPELLAQGFLLAGDRERRG